MMLHGHCIMFGLWIGIGRLKWMIVRWVRAGMGLRACKRGMMMSGCCNGWLSWFGDPASRFGRGD